MFIAYSLFLFRSMPIYQTRWSAKRLRDIANSIQGKKRDVLSKSSFGDLLQISPLLPPPEGLDNFIVMRIDTKKRLLKYVSLEYLLLTMYFSVFYLFDSTFISSQHLLIFLFYIFLRRINDRKKMHFTKDMVKKIFNVPSGSRPVEFSKRGKADFRDVYLDGDRALIATTVVVLSKVDDEDEETIDRSWVLLCLSLVLAPGTGNMVPLEYLCTLRDMSVFHELEWDEHILLHVTNRGMRWFGASPTVVGQLLVGAPPAVVGGGGGSLSRWRFLCSAMCFVVVLPGFGGGAPRLW